MRKEHLDIITEDLIDDLPAVLRQVADAVGIAAACKLAMDFGGRDVYIPLHAGETHPLVRSLGQAAADKLIALFGRGALEVPLGPTTYDARVAAAIKARLAEGQSESQIARALGVTIRTVRRHRAKLKDTHPRLFE